MRHSKKKFQILVDKSPKRGYTKNNAKRFADVKDKHTLKGITMSKLYTFAGVSRRPSGEMKARFANDMLRLKVLIKGGDKDIDIIELKHAMTKEDAVRFLIDIDFATRDGVTNQEVKAALEAEMDKRTEKAEKAQRRAEKPAKEPKAAKAPKAPKTAKSKAAPSLESIKAKKSAPKSTVSKAEIMAQLADVEDAPF